MDVPAELQNGNGVAPPIHPPQEPAPLRRFLVCACGCAETQNLAVLCDDLRGRVDLKIVATNSALRMFNRAAIEGVPIYSDEDQWSFCTHNKTTLFEDLCAWADLILVIPASSNTLTKIAVGLCDNLLTLVVKNFTGRVFLVPAMNWTMWTKPIMVQQVEELRNQGYRVIDPPHTQEVLEDGTVVIHSRTMANLTDVINWMEINLGQQGAPQG